MSGNMTGLTFVQRISRQGNKRSSITAKVFKF